MGLGLGLGLGLGSGFTHLELGPSVHALQRVKATSLFDIGFFWANPTQII